MNMDYLRFFPILKERIWGGKYLADLYQKSDLENPIGEAWLISGISDNYSDVIDNNGNVFSFKDIYQSNPTFFNPTGKGDFPLLVKYIDAMDKLSVQVHPTDEYAKKNKLGNGKTECWFVTEAIDDAELVIGHSATTKQEFKKAIDENKLSTLMVKAKVKKGDFVFIPAGTIHAIGAGIRIMEIQQPSDVTYRLYDYDRLDRDGKPRPLKIKEALETTVFPSPAINVIHTDGKTGVFVLTENPYFTVERIVSKDLFTYINLDKSPVYLVITEGLGIVNGIKAKTGDALMVSSEHDKIDIIGNLGLLAIKIPETLK